MSDTTQPSSDTAAPPPPRTALQHLLLMKVPRPFGMFPESYYLGAGRAALDSAYQEDWALAHSRAQAEKEAWQAHTAVLVEAVSHTRSSFGSRGLVAHAVRAAI